MRHLILPFVMVLLFGASAADGLEDVPMPALRDAMRDWDGLAQAWFRLKAGDSAGARTEAKRLLRERPGDPDALHLLGIAATADGRPLEGERALRRSLRRRSDGWVGVQLVNLLLGQGRDVAAEKVVADLGGRLPADPQVRRARVYLLVARNQLEDARDGLLQLEAAFPTAEIAHQLAALLAEMGDVGAALDAAGRAVERSPEDGALRRHHFELLASLGRWSELEAVASAAGAASVGGGLDSYWKGVALARQGKEEPAVRALASVAEHGQPDAVALAGAAGWLLQLSAFGEAEKAARRALLDSPERPALHHLLAMVLSRQGRESEGLAHYRRAADSAPEDATYRFDLLVSLCDLDRADELEDSLARAQRDFDEDPRFGALGDRCGASGP